MTNNNNKYSPELRFPEFQDKGEWNVIELGQFARIVMGQSPSSKNYNSDRKGIPLLQGNADIKDRKQKLRIYTTEVIKTCDANDIIMTVRAPVGTISRALFFSCIGRGVCAIKTDSDYLYHYLVSIEQEWEKYASGSTFSSIILDQVYHKKIIIPQGTLEQKKIADCLSSLDIYLDTTKHKLELLKEYKKGLMQQLFPRNGKNVPELRLPEFQNAPVWVYQALGSIGDTYGGLSGKSAEDFGKGKPYVTYKQVFTSIEIDFSNCSLVRIAQNEKQNKLQYGDILVTISSETPEEIGYTALVTTKKIPECYLNSFCFIFRLFDKRKIDINFMIYLLSSDVYRKNVVRIAQGITRFNISKTRYKEIELPIPSSKVEQRKIAKLLSSIDQQLTHYEEKIRSLELHKKGLTQRLFPKI